MTSCEVALCQLPDSFSSMDLREQAEIVHACHEEKVEETARCSARHAELIRWVEARTKKEGSD
jgi:hypothetical protein